MKQWTILEVAGAERPGLSRNRGSREGGNLGWGGARVGVGAGQGLGRGGVGGWVVVEVGREMKHCQNATTKQRR